MEGLPDIESTSFTAQVNAHKLVGFRERSMVEILSEKELVTAVAHNENSLKKI